MRLVTRHADVEPLGRKRTVERDNALAGWLSTEIEDAFAARQPQERVWRECLRQAAGVPKFAMRNIPVENAPNVEVTLGAMYTDIIFAQALDLIYQVAPVITVRPLGPAWTDHAVALQRFANWGASNEWNLRATSEQSLYDTCQLGTGVYYIPWVENCRKTAGLTTEWRAPRTASIAPENFIVPGGSDTDVQTLPWVGMRYYLREGEMALRAEKSTTEDGRTRWDTSKTVPVGHVGWVRDQRERLGRTRTSRQVTYMYELIDVYCYFDYDGDGIEEDLLVTWDRTSKSIVQLGYSPSDTRPFAVARYWLQPHLFYGVGVMEMVRPYQDELTELHCHMLLNVLLANSRMWATKPGVLPEGAKMFPSKNVECSNPSEDIKPLQMGEVYPSLMAAQQLVTTLAERRVGVNEASTAPGRMGNRTPGITALSMMQAGNRRFTPPYDQMRFAHSEAARQCLFRYQEQLLAGDREVRQHLDEVLGPKDGALVAMILKNPKFDQAVAIELTAASVSVNREADRQNAMLLMQSFDTYYEKMMALVGVTTNPQAPEGVKNAAKQVIEKANTAMQRFVETFDQVRDPRAFLIELDDLMEGGAGESDPQGQLPQLLMGALQQAMGGPGGGGGGFPQVGGGAPGEEAA
jgi:hypothetical protein